MYRRSLRRLGLAGIVTMVGAAMAAPASAGDIPVTVTVEAVGTQALFVTHDTEAVPLSSVTGYAASAQEAAGALHPTTVTDERGSLVGGNWTVSVTGTDLTFQGDVGTETRPVIGAANGYVFVQGLDLVGGTLDGALNGTTVLGGADSVNATGSDLSTSYTLLTGTTLPLQGSATATFTPSMRVEVPANTPAGEYTGTVTQSVS